MSRYTAGFLFWRDSVALIRKARPDWQAGLLNAIGGHIEKHESIHECQVREFQEETGLYIPVWRSFCDLSGDGWIVHFFSAALDGGNPCPPLRNSDETEPVEWFATGDARWGKTIPNLQWLIPMAMDSSVVGAEVKSW